jgi:hypothetical protein
MRHYRITTRSVVLSEYVVRAENEENARDELMDGSWLKEEILDYEKEQVLKVELLIPFQKLYKNF